MGTTRLAILALGVLATAAATALLGWGGPSGREAGPVVVAGGLMGTASYRDGDPR